MSKILYDEFKLYCKKDNRMSMPNNRTTDENL